MTLRQIERCLFEYKRFSNISVYDNFVSFTVANIKYELSVDDGIFYLIVSSPQGKRFIIEFKNWNELMKFEGFCIENDYIKQNTLGVRVIRFMLTKLSSSDIYNMVDIVHELTINELKTRLKTP
jgi:hypothetical protein